MCKEKFPLQEGQKFGMLTVIKLDHVKRGFTKEGWQHNRFMYLCKCDCGNYCVVDKTNLNRGDIISCGCYRYTEECRRKIGNGRRRHGKCTESIYSIWQNMKNRCFNSNLKAYKNYGGRGITVCDAWKNDFNKFLEWAESNGYKDGLSIERIDVNGNYCPENCTWIPLKVQAKNKRNTRLITYKGETHCLVDWAEKLGMNRGTLRRRLTETDWNIEEVFTKALRETHLRNITYKGKTQSIRAWEKELGFGKNTLYKRIVENGMGVEEAFKLPVKRQIHLTHNGETHCLKEWSLIYGKDESFFSRQLRKGRTPIEIFSELSKNNEKGEKIWKKSKIN